jgi:hypothetical protein
LNNNRMRLSPVMIGTAVVALGVAVTGCSGNTKHAAGASASGSADAASSGTAAATASRASGSGSSGASSRPKGSATGTASPGSTGTGSGPAASAGAGQEDGGSGTAQSCKVVAATAVSAAFAGKLSSARAGVSGTGSQSCRFGFSTSNVGGVVVNVSIHSPANRAAFDSSRTAAIKDGAVAVPGVGDSAYYVPGSANLQFISGSLAGAVQASKADPAAQVKADVTTVAKSVVATNR